MVLSDDRHLLGVHLVAVDEVSEETSVGVGKVVRLLHDHIWVVSHPGVEVVVLQMGRVEVLSSVLVTPVLTDHALEVHHGEVVSVTPPWSLKGH